MLRASPAKWRRPSAAGQDIYWNKLENCPGPKNAFAPINIGSKPVFIMSLMSVTLGKGIVAPVERK
jgi:hypothetical protein